MSIEDTVNEILKKEKSDQLYSVAADVLRALVILHGSAWQSDLMDTLTGLWSIKSLELDEMIGREDVVPKAIKLLNEKGLVRSEERLRGDLSRQEPVKDELHTATNLITLIRLFTVDSLIEKYKRDVMGYSSLGY